MNAAAKKGAARATPSPRTRGSLDRTLIEAAMDLFADYGYRGTSLSRIARAAGVTKGALYWHFEDKEDFFVKVAERVLDDWANVFEARTPAHTAARFRQEFLETFTMMAKLNKQQPWVSRLLLIVSLESHKIGRRVLRMIRKQNLRGFGYYRRLIERGQALGALNPELDVESAATEIYATYLGLATLWYLHGDAFDLARSLERQGNDFLRQWGKPE